MAALKCLIYERDAGGHRLHHVRHLAEALLQIGSDVVIALQADVRERDEFKVHIAPLESHVRLRTNLNPLQKNDYVSTAARVDELTAAIDEEQADWAYIPYADMMTQAAAVRALMGQNRRLRDVPIEGQVLRGRFAYPATTMRERLGSAVRQWLTRRSPWRVTHILDPWVFDNLAGAGRTTEFRRIPEPIDPLPELDRMEARRQLGIPQDGHYFATAGVLDERKGIDLLLSAFAASRLQAQDRLLLMGQVDPGLRELITRQYSDLRRSGRLVVIDGYVSDFNMACCYLAADVIVAPHPRQVGSSGTLVRGAAAKRPVIASDYGWMGWASRTFVLGTTVDFTDQEAYVAAIEEAVRALPTWRQSDKAARFCQYHTTHNQKAHWLVSLAEERGIPLGDYNQRIEWSWVTEGTDIGH